MMVRIAGCIFITGATTLGGIQRAKRLRDQYREMQYLYKIICSIQSEIRYARAYLSEIFTETGQKLKNPYKDWLVQLGRWMEEEHREMFDEMWKKSIGKYLSESLLPKKELEKLDVLGGQLGIADMEIQIRFLDLYLEQMDQTMKEMQDEMKTRIRLNHCLGVMSGILISVLLL